MYTHTFIVIPVFVIAVDPDEDQSHEEKDNDRRCNQDCHVSLIPGLD